MDESPIGTVFSGGCHCGNIRVRLRLTTDPAAVPLRACTCSFCRAHATRTLSDPAGLFEAWAEDWADVERYRFGTRTADYLVCRRCGVYIAAVCETDAGPRAVVNINSLDARAEFTQPASPTDRDGESETERADRRAGTWMPALLHASSA
jgi:hypothetical protein